MDHALKSVSEKLRHYREACALSQKQVADALNIERSTYTKYETGDSEPNLNTLVKIAAIYNVSPIELLPEATENPMIYKQLKDTVQSDSPIYQLNKDERSLIAKYRVLSKENKQQIHELMGKMSKND